MTTALISKEGATGVKARVAIVSKGGAAALAEHLAQAGHEIREFSAWEPLLATDDAGSLDLVFFDDDLASSLPESLATPAVHVTAGVHISSSGCLGVIPNAAPGPAVDAMLALAVELRLAAGHSRDLELLVEGVRSGSALVGRSPVMRRLHGVISRAADSDVTILIEGPSGAGKSLVARVVHCKSRRSDKALRVVDCATLDAEGVGTALIGARGTTLVLEQIDRLAMPAQAVLVRHLKDRSGKPANQVPRIIATVSAHLPEMVARGAFREDLYYRLNAFPMLVPSLRERTEDIEAIVEAILAVGAVQPGRTQPGLTASAMSYLQSMPWPGNVAQLELVLKRAQALAGGQVIDREHLIMPASASNAAGAHPGPAPVERDTADAELCEEAIRPFEEEEQLLLSRALRATKGNVRRAAQLLGIGRATLYRKIQQYKLRLQ